MDPNVSPTPTPEQTPGPVVPEVPTPPPAAAPAVPAPTPVPDPMPAPATATSPVMPPSDTPGVPTVTPLPGTPAIADDVDVIEKEWVDKAEQVVEQTKDDPYAEEEAVEKLQVDYLKKRYDHDVAEPQDG